MGGAKMIDDQFVVDDAKKKKGGKPIVEVARKGARSIRMAIQRGKQAQRTKGRKRGKARRRRRRGTGDDTGGSRPKENSE